MAAPDLLERIDRIMAELAELRAGVAGAAADNEKGMESGRSAQERRRAFHSLPGLRRLDRLP
jgi:hypothetical protein